MNDKATHKLHYTSDTAEPGTILGPSTDGTFYVVVATSSDGTAHIRRVQLDDFVEASRRMKTFGKAPRSITEHTKLYNEHNRIEHGLAARRAAMRRIVSHYTRATPWA